MQILPLPWQADGGSDIEHLGLQNIQASLQNGLSVHVSISATIKIELYISSSLFVTNTYPGDNCLSLLYDCSSADIDPIGSISKMDLRTFQKWASVHLGYSSLAEIEAPPPTAEVEPIC
ncbi:Glutamine-dependent NAD(+) synthetase [Capsicum baccatum]|uniref:Glutamine-dependent NAD(+) synthetase n=1 Tax=Capsicum baccatum TaxID=33114 RepID=A0A2G2WLT6_CAPBA|nr:Glutamine-dependent NAD(+) synthetase [Capsicum baccatum]